MHLPALLNAVEKVMSKRPIDMLGIGPKYHEVRTEKGWRIHVIPGAWADGPGASVELTDDQHHRYRLWRDGGVLIQNALPELTPSQREILMTGLDDEAFKRATEEPEG